MPEMTPNPWTAYTLAMRTPGTGILDTLYMGTLLLAGDTTMIWFLCTLTCRRHPQLMPSPIALRLMSPISIKMPPPPLHLSLSTIPSSSQLHCRRLSRQLIIPWRTLHPSGLRHNTKPIIPPHISPPARWAMGLQVFGNGQAPPRSTATVRRRRPQRRIRIRALPNNHTAFPNRLPRPRFRLREPCHTQTMPPDRPCEQQPASTFRLPSTNSHPSLRRI